jgi:translocation and assembly module TamA
MRWSKGSRAATAGACATALGAMLLACAVPALAWAQGAGRQPGVEDAPPQVRDADTGPKRAGESEEERDTATAPGVSPAQARPLTVTWQAPQPLRGMFQQFLKPPSAEAGERRAASLRPWIREVRKRVPEIAASEGYFSANVEIEFDSPAREHATVTVTPGPRTSVAAVDIEFRGDLASDTPEHERRRRELVDAFGLRKGQPMRSPDWEVAKTKLVESLRDLDYAAGALAESQAAGDAEQATAHLHLVLDSGPPFTMGDVEIHGLKHYSESTVRRLVDLQRGERFSMERLTTLQRLVQTGPWFSSVVIDVPRDPQHPDLVPVNLTVVERPRREVGLALGYGTDDGARAEAAFRDRNVLDRFDLQSSLRLAQKDQIGYADFYANPGLAHLPHYGDVPFTDSFGVLVEHSDISNLVSRRFAIAGYRHFRLEKFETQAGLSYQIERTEPQGSDETIRRALAPVVQFTWRFVDNIFDPRRGGVLNVQLAAGFKSFFSGDDFLKTYLQYQHWIALGPMDQLVLRTEWGRTFVTSRQKIPEDFLFRAGGSRSNRGYAYQSLGVQEGDAVVGGRYLATGTAEYVHWLNDKWGAAVFTDIGDAADSIAAWQPLKSYGVGARFRTPAGPFALDLAYAERDHKFRLAFSVNVAF